MSLELTKAGTIICVGMCVLDIVHNCAEYPKEDTDKRCQNSHLQRGGNASNNCTVLSQLGAKCEFLGMLSSSTAFNILKQDLLKRNISIDNCPQTEQDPPYSSVILSEASGSRTIIHANNNFPILTHKHFEQLILCNKYSWIHFEGRNIEETSQIMQRIKNYNSVVPSAYIITTSVEIEKCREELFDLVAYADYVFIGKDLATHMGWKNKREAVYAIEAKHTVQVICTWGSEGCASLDDNGNYVDHSPVHVSKIVDSLGAGDTFCAATIYALNNLKMKLINAVDFGNRCAAFKLQHDGFDQIFKFKQI